MKNISTKDLIQELRSRGIDAYPLGIKFVSGIKHKKKAPVKSAFSRTNCPNGRLEL